MSRAIIMIYINSTNFVLISELEKDHSMIETRQKMLLFFANNFKLCAVKKNLKNNTQTLKSHSALKSIKTIRNFGVPG